MVYPPIRVGIEYPEMQRSLLNTDKDGLYRRLVTDSLLPTLKLFLLRASTSDSIEWEAVRTQLARSVYHYHDTGELLGDGNWLAQVILDHLEHEFKGVIEQCLRCLKGIGLTDIQDIEFAITPHYSFYVVEFKQREYYE